MANVYTKRSKIPRTTTATDYGYYSQALKMLRQYDMQNKEAEVLRVLSPTRRQNPQPVGLVYQSPYNRQNQIFGIWNPDPLVPVVRCRETLPHLQRTNFTCRPDPEFLGKRMLPSDLNAPVVRRQPEITYTCNTVQRQYFRWPDKVPEKFEGMVKRTRFGHTCRKNACPMSSPRNSPTKSTDREINRLSMITYKLTPHIPGPGCLPVTLPMHRKGKHPTAKNHSSCCQKIKVIV